MGPSAGLLLLFALIVSTLAAPYIQGRDGNVAVPNYTATCDAVPTMPSTADAAPVNHFKDGVVNGGEGGNYQSLGENGGSFSNSKPVTMPTQSSTNPAAYTGPSNVGLVNIDGGVANGGNGGNHDSPGGNGGGILGFGG